MQNYFSVGVDANVALRFDEARTAKPEAFRSALLNKVKYALLGSSLALRGASSLEKRLASVRIDGREIPLPAGTKSVVLLNIPSFGAGTDPWGAGGHQGEPKKMLAGHRVRTFAAPACDDGALEVVALFGVLHAAALHNPLSLARLRGYGGKRLGQGRVVELRFRTASEFESASAKSARARPALAAQVDGEAWAFPWEGEAARVALKGRVGVLLGPRHAPPPSPAAPARWPSARLRGAAEGPGPGQEAATQRSAPQAAQQPSEGVLREPVV